jgi:purine nucleoside permease
VRCNADGICQMTTGMGHANAAASTMALILSQRFDLRKAYILIAGIAGINPELGSIGSATWARYLVDFGLQHEIDPREMPKDWQGGFLGLQTSNPGQKPKLNYGTELFQVDEILLDKIIRLTSGAKLADSDAARAYRAHYAAAPANQPPAIIQCDTLADDTYWHGGLIGKRASAWTLLVTDGKGTYCTTEQEDNATFEALRRGQAAGLLDLKRVAVLRTASNFDRPYPGQSVVESLAAKSGGFPISIANLYLAAAPWVNDLVSHWEQWQDGVPKD